MDVFTDLVEILSGDRVLLRNKGKFVGSLGISWAAVDPFVKLFDLGHSSPYDFIKAILTEWISARKDSATIAELRRILREQKLFKLSDQLEKLEEMHPGRIKTELESWPINANENLQNMEVLPELVEILSKERYLLQNKRRFVSSLGISGAIIDPYFKLYDLGLCRPNDLVIAILTEWISIKKDSATIAELRRILQESNFQRCSHNLEKLQEMHPGAITIPGLETSRRNDPFVISPRPHSSDSPPPTENTKSRPITFGLKSVVQNFTGREEELARLNQYFHSRETPVVLISGLGGIGKTELVKKFALELSDAFGNGQIVKCWLSGENPQSLLNSITQFCDQLQLPSKWADGQPLRIKEMIKNIMKKLKSSEEFKRWVIIIDNVDDIHSEFESTVQVLSEYGSDGFLLVTSRRRDIYEGEVERLEVTEMQLKDSMTFVRKSLKIADNSSEDAIKSLCEILGNFPLALNQALAFIRQQQVFLLNPGSNVIPYYLEELAKNEKLGLDKDPKLGYSTATLKVWSITIDKIRNAYGKGGQLALDLLDAMAFINHDDIPIRFLQKLHQRFYSVEEITWKQLRDSLTLLRNYSLISSYAEVLRIHRLVQLSLRDRMSSKSPTEDGQPSKDVKMLSAFWTHFDEKDWNQVQMRNAVIIWNHTKKHKELNVRMAVNTVKICKLLSSLGMVNELYDFAIEGSKFLKALHGPEDQEYCKMEHFTALALQEKGQYESALQKFTTVYSKFKEIRGEDDDWTLEAGYSIASCLYDLERFEDFLEWGQKVLRSQISINGEKNEKVIKTKNQVALTLKELGRKKEAVKLLYEIFEWQEANLEANHPSILTTRQHIATCLSEIAEAPEILQDINETTTDEMDGSTAIAVTDNSELAAEVVLEAKEYSANEFMKNIHNAKSTVGDIDGNTIVTGAVELICNNRKFENITFRSSVTVVGNENKFSKITVIDATDTVSGLIIYGSDNVLDDITVCLSTPD